MTASIDRRFLAMLIILLVQGVSLPAKETAAGMNAGEDVQKLVPAIYWISPEESQRIGSRFLDMINAVRDLLDRKPLTFAPHLNYAAFIHARDLNEQQKTWNFGTNGTSPVLRVAEAGYEGTVLGENVVQAFDPPLVVVHGMLRDQRSRNNILNSAARHLGVGWFQNEEGRTWWVFITGR